MRISKKDRVTDTANKNVQERLLDAAGQLFCERGFDGTSVRDLAGAAECNVASVNYYFGSKEKLYGEVWRRLLVPMRQARLESIRQVMEKTKGSPPLEELLRSFAYAFIGPLVDENKARQLLKLMAREMLDEHLPPNMFVEEIIKPTMSAMNQALLKACPQLDQSKIPLLVFSVVAQLVHVIRIKAMFEQTHTSQMPALDLTKTIDHIVKFSTAGIHAYARRSR